MRERIVFPVRINLETSALRRLFDGSQPKGIQLLFVHRDRQRVLLFHNRHDPGFHGRSFGLSLTDVVVLDGRRSDHSMGLAIFAFPVPRLLLIDLDPPHDPRPDFYGSPIRLCRDRRHAVADLFDHSPVHANTSRP